MIVDLIGHACKVVLARVADVVGPTKGEQIEALKGCIATCDKVIRDLHDRIATLQMDRDEYAKKHAASVMRSVQVDLGKLEGALADAQDEIAIHKGNAQRAEGELAQALETLGRYAGAVGRVQELERELEAANAKAEEYRGKWETGAPPPRRVLQVENAVGS